jgi:glycosyltransferase involved in cell wall biosynthesis
MRILLISSSYPPVLGGLQTVAHTLAQHLTRRGNTVQVVTNHYPRSLPAYQVLDGVPVHRWLFLIPEASFIQRRRWDLLLASLYFYPSTLLRLAQLMRTFRPAVVNVHFPDTQAPFVLWLRRYFNFRLVVSLHGHEVLKWFETSATHTDSYALSGDVKQQPHFRSLVSTLQRADAVTACSSYLLQRAAALEPSVAEKGQVIHNGIDLERFEDRTSYSHPRPYILAYGRQMHHKGFDMLLEAFARIRAKHPHVGLILAGEGEAGPTLQALAQQLGIAKQVHFLGRVTPTGVVRLLNGCLLLAVPSRREPFGIVALEGLAAGKPVLASRVGGIAEFLDGSSNQLVEPTIDGLAVGLARWLDHTDELQALAEENRSLAARYTWPRVVDRYVNSYH